MTILVTGSSGLIGSDTVEHFDRQKLLTRGDDRRAPGESFKPWPPNPLA